MKSNCFHFLFTMLLLFSIKPAQSQNPGAAFRQKFLGGNDINTRINGMSFLTPSTGFVAFINEVGFTRDSGQSYIYRPIQPSNTDYNGYPVNLTFGFRVTGVHAVSEDSLLAYGDFGAEPSILFSADQGQHWKLIFHLALSQNNDIANSILDMKFTSGMHGIAIDEKYIFETTNGGMNWYNQFPPSPAGNFSKISVLPSGTAYVVAGDCVYKKPAGGRWSVLPGHGLPQHSVMSFHNISFSSETNGYLTDDFNRGIYRTTDGGLNWHLVNDTALSPVLASDMHFINDSTGFVSLRYGYQVWKTRNYGVTWEACKRDTSYQYEFFGINRMFFLNDQVAWAGGVGEYLMLTTTGGDPTFPKALFKIDTALYTATQKVRLVNYSDPGYHYQWFRNRVLLGSSDSSFSYLHNIYETHDTIELIVDNGGDSDTLVQYQDFPVYRQQPVIASFSPQSGGTHTVVTIKGIGFDNASAVTFGGIPALSFVVNSNDSITAIVNGGSSGSVAVTSPGGTGTIAGFTYESPAPPLITSISPNSGPIGIPVVITGNNFDDSMANNIVYFGKVKAQVTGASSHQITCLVPPGSSFDPVSVVNLTRHLSGYSEKTFNVTFPGNNVVTADALPHVLDIPLPKIYGIQLRPEKVNAGDMDGDGKNDLVTIINHGGQDSICIYRNTSTGHTISFDQKMNIVPNNYGYDIIADLDNDGKPDIAYLSGYNIAVIRNSSSPGLISFESPASWFSVTGTQEMCARDLDGDGRPEMIMAGYNERKLGILRNVSVDSTIAFAPRLQFDGGALEETVACDDLDGDGKPDVVTGGERTVSIFQNTSTPEHISFLPRTDIAADGSVRKVFLADLDGDGKPDMTVVYGSTLVGYSVFKNTSTPGHISFAPAINFAYPDLSYIGAIDNFTGDTLPDLYCKGYFGDADFLQKNISTRPGTNFDDGVKTSNGTDFISAIASDFDGDGKPDVAVVDGNSHVSAFHIFQNNMGRLIDKTPRSVTITTANTHSCAGDSIAFKAKVTNTGTTLFYQWKRNGTDAGVNSNIFTTDLLQGQDSVFCLVTVDSSSPVKSNTITMHIDMVVQPGISITTSDTALCSGVPVTFTAHVTNGGSTPSYQWQVNGVNQGSNSNTFTSDSLNDHDEVRCLLTSSNLCTVPARDTSNVMTMHITRTLSPSVSVTASDTSVCAGQPVTFTALPNSAGNNPGYQWQVNGINIIGSDPVFTADSLQDSSIVTVILTSKLACVTASSDTSVPVLIHVSDPIPSVDISPVSAGGCIGEIIRFTATIANGGSSPVLQWKKNGIAVGSNNIFYSDSNLVNGDEISATLTSNAVCVRQKVAGSNILHVNLANPSIPSIRIAGPVVVTGTPKISSMIFNGGTIPIYQWQDSTHNHGWQDISGADSSALSYHPYATGDQLRCTLSTLSTCLTPLTATSNTLKFTVVPVDFTGTEVYLFPNPASSVLTIGILHPEKNWTSLQILDASGNTISLQNTGGKTEITLPVNQLSRGVYFGVFTNSHGDSHWFKFIKN